jgi:hypothetical protein
LGGFPNESEDRRHARRHHHPCSIPSPVDQSRSSAAASSTERSRFLDGEARAIDTEEPDKLLQPIFNPLLAVRELLAAEKALRTQREMGRGEIEARH